MNWVSILILVLIVVATIFILTYVAHKKDSTMCFGCHGDCGNCDKKEKPDGEKEENL